MRIGLAILHPGRLKRRAALAVAGKKAVTLLYGAAAMIFIAAIFEAFVSATRLPPTTKYTLGISFWVLIAAYIIFCGRGSAREFEQSETV
jgi:uncharacterized membrane protein SpoIIM required for sporulation